MQPAPDPSESDPIRSEPTPDPAAQNAETGPMATLTAKGKSLHLSPRRWVKLIAQQLIRVRWLSVLLAVVLFAVAYPLASRLQMDRSVTAMFHSDDPTPVSYTHLTLPTKA